MDGQPARMLAGDAFEATIQATPGTNTFTVEATDTSGNVTTQSYEVNVTGTGASFVYDANGNLTEKTEGTDIWEYEWDAENRLVSVDRNAVEMARFEYDPLGRRVEKVAGGVTTAYVYDGQDILEETSGTATFKYIHGPGIDEPLGREDSLGAITYYHADGLGSIIKMTGPGGAVVHQYRYDAWGNIEAGSAQAGYAYTAREWDPETDLYYYRARYYDPRIGRFLSEDGLNADLGMSAYMYVRNNPINNSDPSGYCTCFFAGNVGKLTVDCSCKGVLRLWVIAETESPASGATAGETVEADGYVLNGTTYKIDGSTCVRMDCTDDTVTVSACVNYMAGILGKTGPYQVAPGTFGGPPKEPALGAIPPLVN